MDDPFPPSGASPAEAHLREAHEILTNSVLPRVEAAIEAMPDYAVEAGRFLKAELSVAARRLRNIALHHRTAIRAVRGSDEAGR